MCQRRDLLRALCALPPALLLAGCTRLLPGSGPPPSLYQLSPKSTFSERLPRVDWQLTVEVPFASTALNTARIAIQQSPTQIDYYARASWTDRAPLMVQTLMVESFENSRRIVGIGRDAIGLRSDFVLKTELREFQVEAYHPDSGQVHVSLDAKLVKMPERTIVAAAEFMEMAAADVDDLNTVIPAFDQALGGLLKRLVEWTLISGEAALRKAGAASAAPAGPASPRALPARSAPTARRPAPTAAARR